MDKCPALEKVNIHMSPSAASWDVEDMKQEFETDNSLKQEYVQRMTFMGKEVFHAKSLTLSVHLSKETGEEQLLFALPMVQDFEDHLLAFIIAGMASKKCSILSSNRRYSWTNIQSLNFCRCSFLTRIAFQVFVTHVLHHCKDLNLVKLEFYCFDGGLWESLDSINNAIIGTLTSIVFEYAISRRFEELETDVVDNFPPTLFECQTLKTIKLVQPRNFLMGLSSFATLTTLQLYQVEIDLENDTLSGCLNLENLLLIECAVPEDTESVMKVFSISASRLVNLQISGLIYNGLIVINASRLKFFNLNGTYPLFLSMVKCSSLEKVNLHMSPADDDMMPTFETDKLSMQQYICGMILVGKGLYNVKLFTFVHLSKEIGSTWLVGLAPNF
ncbi:hypothetical protein LWI28_010963 [Acer negundo]|uniref:Uncharacterized protein n=1 Tax=Acer negundo TaxID=4023 RepID=A0AAD5IUQ1_ACENE|nr:hypothetical protein LWI28_010963 [Acer negundo]